MRAFWIIIAVLALVTAWLFIGSDDDGERSRDDAASVAGGDSPQGSRTASTPAQAANLPAPAPGSAPPANADELVDDLMASANRGAQGVDNALRDGAAGSPPRNPNRDASGEFDIDIDIDDDDIDADADAPAAAAGAPAANGAGNAALPAFNPANPIDGKYIVGGEGTEDDPYQITWDLLLLASNTYQPRLGRVDIPPHIQAIDGKHIVIDGYFAFPMASTDAREVLFMLNMWDGCCIGVPPSPYDAIEVRLRQPLSAAGKLFVNYGTLTGAIKIDPYVQNGWLLGMYVMEDGELDLGM